MRLKEIFENFGVPRSKRLRVGIIPYCHIDGVLHLRLMIPSDPAYGGTEPQIAKGRIEEGEDPVQSAIREGEEELGLVPGNIQNTQLMMTDTITGMTASYDMNIYITEVKDPTKWGEFHYETGWSDLLSIDDALSKVRQSQKKYIEEIMRKVDK